MLIVGIDPGTKVGYAVYDIFKDKMHLGSKKELSADNLIRILASFGKISIISTDKKKLPSFVKRIAVKLGTSIYTPPDDIKIKEKNIIAKDLDVNNSHERDAAAAAVFAYQSYKPKIDEMINFLKKSKKSNITNITDKFIDYMLKNPEISYVEALSRLTAKNTFSKNKPKHPVNTESSKKTSTAKSQLNKLEKHNNALEKELKKAKQRIKDLKNSLNKRNYPLQKKRSSSEKQLMNIISKKENRIKSLASKLKIQTKKTSSEISKLNKLISYIHSNDEIMLLPFLEDLKTFPETINSKILFIKNPNIFIPKAINKLSPENVIITPSKPSLKLKNIIPCSIKYWKDEFFDVIKDVAIINKVDFEKKESEADISSIISDYRKSRKEKLTD